jgi:hypothetical protein
MFNALAQTKLVLVFGESLSLLERKRLTMFCLSMCVHVLAFSLPRLACTWMLLDSLNDAFEK